MLPLVEALPIRTQRLTLRLLSETDADDLASMLADPRVMRFFPRTMTRLEAEAWLYRNMARSRRDGTGLFAVCLGSEWIGDCGIIRRQIDGEDVFELGYHFRYEAWRHGYATEAARACIDVAFARADAATLPGLSALIRSANRRSRRVAERLGFRLDGAVLHAGLAHEHWTLQRPRPDSQGRVRRTVR